MNVAIFISCSLLLVFVVSVTVTLAQMRRDITRERDERRELRSAFHEHLWDTRAAFRVLGLKKTPKQDPEWTKD